jgi:hypothetical protein
MSQIATNSGHTRSMPAPRYKIAWASMTKCVVGGCEHDILNRLRHALACRKASGKQLQRYDHNNDKQAKLRHGPCYVARKMPRDVVANRCIAAPARKSTRDPSVGIPITP